MRGAEDVVRFVGAAALLGVIVTVGARLINSMSGDVFAGLPKAIKSKL